MISLTPFLYRYKRITRFGIVFAFVAMVIGIAFMVWASYNRKITPAQAANLPLPPDKSNPAPVMSKTVNAIQTVNGYSLELKEVRWLGSRLLADFCYTLPSEADWIIPPDAAALTVNGETFPHDEYGLMTMGNEENTLRCVYISFPLRTEVNLSEFSISVDRLMTDVPERPDCAKAQVKLDQAKTGIVIECELMPHISGFSIVQRSPAMSDEEALKIAEDAFSDILEGPWIFPVTLP
jgi:hypothetical protein